MNGRRNGGRKEGSRRCKVTGCLWILIHSETYIYQGINIVEFLFIYDVSDVNLSSRFLMLP